MYYILRYTYTYHPTLNTAIDSTYERVGGGSGPIIMDYVNCTGSEPKLWDECIHFTHYYGCSHDNDIGVKCQPGKGTCMYKCFKAAM